MSSRCFSIDGVTRTAGAYSALQLIGRYCTKWDRPQARESVKSFHKRPRIVMHILVIKEFSRDLECLAVQKLRS